MNNTRPAISSRRLLNRCAALDSIATQVLDGLNAGLRIDQVVDGVALPPALAQRHDLREDYGSAKDIARMVVKQYTGWWDDIPSHWNPAPMATQAKAIAELAGGAQALMARAKLLSATDPATAAALADWAWLAAPTDSLVLQGALDVYGARINDKTTTQEALVYLEHMVRLKVQLQMQQAKP